MEPSAGRPRIGTAVHIRLPDELLARVDQLAEARGGTRAEMLRVLIVRAVDAYWACHESAITGTGERGADHGS